jgi:glutamate-1-semialdehyde 2,1-aminomutase
MKPIDRARVAGLMERERATFRRRHAQSGQLFQHAKRSLLFGVPMNWMTRWPGDHPVFVDRAAGASFRDVDGNEFIDFCLGDTGGMAGHAPKAAVDAIARQAARGITLMLPTEDAAWVGDELARRFGLPYWQFTLSATDANRSVIRWAREITGRPKIIVHNGCYHGTVDESVAMLENGRTVARSGNIGKPVPLDQTTRVVEINDLEGLEAALAHQDVAACLFEPALTNVGIVLPDPGYHAAARKLCDQYGALLIIDETHTISAGPGGCTRAWGLEPDFLTIGKTLGAGVASGAYGLTERMRARVYACTDSRNTDVGGIGGTLAGNALSLAAMRATLGEVMTDTSFVRMIALGERFEQGVRGVIESRELPWHVVRLGCRVEYLFRPERARNGAEAAAGQDDAIDAFIHLYLLNRGILMTPFHNMALMSPATTAADVDGHTRIFSEMAAELLSESVPHGVGSSAA